MILSDVREAELRAYWPKSRRQSVKQKWSFSEMVRQLGTWTKPHFKENLFLSFVSSYGISSHLIHADESGIGVVRNRAQKDPDERYLMDLAHTHKLLNMVLVSSMLMTTGLAVALDTRVPEVIRLVTEHCDLQSYNDPATEALMQKWSKAIEELDA